MADKQYWGAEGQMYTNSYYDSEAEYSNLQSQQLGNIIIYYLIQVIYN